MCLVAQKGRALPNGRATAPLDFVSELLRQDTSFNWFMRPKAVTGKVPQLIQASWGTPSMRSSERVSSHARRFTAGPKRSVGSYRD